MLCILLIWENINTIRQRIEGESELSLFRLLASSSSHLFKVWNKLPGRKSRYSHDKAKYELKKKQNKNIDFRVLISLFRAISSTL
jgi:hypothetical protein